MKLVTFKIGESYSIGVLVNEFILDLNDAYENHLGGAFEKTEVKRRLDMLSLIDIGEEGLAEVSRAVFQAKKDLEEGKDVPLYNLNEVKHVAPIPRPSKNIICLGNNYAEHVLEEKKTPKAPPTSLPEHPIFFTKPHTAVTGPFGNIIYPRSTEKLDYEVELALVIGKKGKYIPEDEVYKHIMGYTVFNDVSARDLQRRHGQWFKGKSCDTFAPMGPYLVTSDELGDPMNLELSLKVNGELRQKSNTKNMIFNIKKIVSSFSEGITLEAGDIFATGTPAGVGSSHPLGLLKIGDVVESCIENIGTMRNRVVEEI